MKPYTQCGKCEERVETWLLEEVFYKETKKHLEVCPKCREKNVESNICICGELDCEGH